MDSPDGLLRKRRRGLAVAILALVPLASPLPLFGAEEGGTPP